MRFTCALAVVSWATTVPFFAWDSASCASSGRAELAESHAKKGTVVAKLTTAEAHVKRMSMEAAAVGEVASDLRAKVPGPVSARPHASVKSAKLH